MIEDDIGTRIRTARVAQGLSLRSTASAIGVSASLLSLVENGRTSPSVGTLSALVNLFGISFDDVMGDPVDAGGRSRAAAVQRVSRNPVVSSRNGVRIERLSGMRGAAGRLLLLTFRPGAFSTVVDGAPQTRDGEHVYLLAGELTVQIGTVAHRLRASDSLALDGTQPRVYHNDGDVVARGVWFVLRR
jgi:transcriptional regulator with XRE-family HTH domain